MCIDSCLHAIKNYIPLEKNHHVLGSFESVSRADFFFDFGCEVQLFT